MRVTFWIILSWNFEWAVPLKKCCSEENVLTKTKFGHFCVKNEEKRAQINAFEDDFLAKNVTGGVNYCVDGADAITRYKIFNQNVIEEAPILVNSFRKCCPLNYYYDSKLHGCIFKNNLDRSFIQQNFVKIGLPDCRILVDYMLESKKLLPTRIGQFAYY